MKVRNISLLKRVIASISCLFFIILISYSIAYNFADKTTDLPVMTVIFDALFFIVLIAYLYSIIANKILFAWRALLILTFFVIGFLVESFYSISTNITPMMLNMGVNPASAFYYTAKSFLIHTFTFWLISISLLSLGYFGLRDIQKADKNKELPKND